MIKIIIRSVKIIKKRVQKNSYQFDSKLVKKNCNEINAEQKRSIAPDGKLKNSARK